VLTLTVNVHVTEPVHIHMHEEPSQALQERVAGLESRLTALTGGPMATMQQAVDRLTEEVTEARTVAESAKTLVTTLAQQIRDNAGNPDALMELANVLDRSNADLQAAVAANTEPPAEQPAV
jgi:uncharacterized coiled-coil protein SlyX